MKSPSSTFSFNRSGWRFVGKMALFVAVVGIAQSLIYWACGGEESVLARLHDHKVALKEKPQVLFFGDSVLSDMEAGSPETSTIPLLLQARIPDTPIGVIADRAYSADLYQAFADYILRQEHLPKLWIFEINLRSFSTGWEQRPEWQFEKEKILLAHDYPLFRIFFRPLSVFKTFRLTPINQQQFEMAPVYDGERAVGTIADFKKRPTLERLFVSNYMYGLQKDDQRLRQLVNLCGLLKNRGVAPMFYLTPVDYQSGDRALGPRFSRRIAENVKVLKVELSEAGCEPVDLSRRLPAEDFNWQGDHYPHEHLKEAGRRKVAAELYRAIDKIRKRPAQITTQAL